MGKTRILSFRLLGVFLLGCVDASRIEIPEPTGDRARDHAAVAEAFERVEPGGTIAFAAGTYLIGSEGLVLRTPGVTLRGHPDGSTLVGCTAEERADPDFGNVYEVCNGFVLGAEEQRVTGLRFESFRSIRGASQPRRLYNPLAIHGRAARVKLRRLYPSTSA